jgi:hypothetical protein
MVNPSKERATEFVVFCIENTAKRLGVSGTDLFLELKRIGGISAFLYPSYTALHTQGKDFIVDETIQFLRNNNSPLVAQSA